MDGYDKDTGGVSGVWWQVSPFLSVTRCNNRWLSARETTPWDTPELKEGKELHFRLAPFLLLIGVLVSVACVLLRVSVLLLPRSLV
ncbi:hypothetical protein O3P69_004769 [Scylla paramamosain]|uniref:Uncharacterized protein n=1 Tax=Scylla paramamosain TaxID=85552 RepID=A0AAW0UBU8_SCYPA